MSRWCNAAEALPKDYRLDLPGRWAWVPTPSGNGRCAATV